MDLKHGEHKSCGNCLLQVKDSLSQVGLPDLSGGQSKADDVASKAQTAASGISGQSRQALFVIHLFCITGLSSSLEVRFCLKLGCNVTNLAQC